MTWKGRDPLPAAPGHPCWLLPTSDDVAVEIARRRSDLRGMGWSILSCDPLVVQKLSDKAMLQDYAQELGLQAHLPARYASADHACYPCILKSATGEFGKDCHIVHSSDGVHTLVPHELGPRWVLQELILGIMEYSVTLLVQNGDLLEIIGTQYEYGSEAYVYPDVRKIGKRTYQVPSEQLAVMRAFLCEYSGICNFNFKIRSDGRLCFFEINTRIGGDLACDVHRDRAHDLFERLDKIIV